MQGGLLALDPVVHRIAHDERGSRHLAQDAELQLGIDVAEKKELGRAKGLGKLGLKVGEHAEPGLERLAALEVVGVLPLPPEALAVRALDAAPIDPAFPETLELGDRVVLADHADHLHRVQQRAGHAEVHRGPPERVGRLAERREDRVERDAADDEQAHQVTSGPER